MPVKKTSVKSKSDDTPKKKVSKTVKEKADKISKAKKVEKSEKTLEKPVKKVVIKVKSKPDLKDFTGEIEKRAYALFLERSSQGIPGDEVSDWAKAESEIKKKFGL